MKKIIVAFGSHPDDVELCCSGTLIKLGKKGYKIIIVDLTRGERGSRGNEQRRLKESKIALDIMGLEFRENLKIPDTNIEINVENRNKIIGILRKYKPEVIFLPYWEEKHPDHRNASKLIHEASFYSGLKNIKTDYESFRPMHNVFYLGRDLVEPTFIVDITNEYQTKMKAIKAYESQFENDTDMDLSETLKTPFSIENLEAKDRFYGSLIGVQFGEPFYLKSPFKNNDPIKLLCS